MSNLIENFKTLKNRAETGHPAWLNTFQDERFANFEKAGIPTVKNEEWKYTNLAQLSKEKFDALTDSEGAIPEEYNTYVNKDELNIVFTNGTLNNELSNITEISGVEIKTLKNALVENEEEIKAILAKNDIGNTDAFIELNNALINDGVFIKAKKGTVSEELIHIVHLTTTDKPIVNNIRTIIVLEESTEINVLESYVAFGNNAKYLSNSLTDCFVNDNATLHYVKAQTESEASYHIGNTRVSVERNANFKGFTLTTNSGFTRNELDIVINGEGSDGTLHSLYSIFNEQHVDNHTSVDHRVPNCTSNQLYKGILNDASHAVFNGKIFVRDIAQQTNSYQLNKNLLLGKKAHVDTKPQLEIFADDVRCTHGATIGQLEEDEIFYLQTRGVSRKDAIRIIATGFAEESVEEIKLKAIQSKLLYLLQPSIDNLSHGQL